MIMTTTANSEGQGVTAPRSEEAVANQWDKCLADTLIKFGSGLGLGIVTSVILFKRRKWPMLFGSGIGLGIGLANCQGKLNDIVTGRAKI